MFLLFYKVGKHSHYRGPRRRGREKGSENVLEEIMAENFPKLERGNRYLGLGSPVSFK